MRSLSLWWQVCSHLLDLSSRTLSAFLLNIVYGSFAEAITTVTSVIHADVSPGLHIVRPRMGMLLLHEVLTIVVGELIGGAFLASSREWMGLHIARCKDPRYRGQVSKVWLAMPC